MDLARDPAILKRRRRRQLIGAGVAALVVLGLSVAVSRLQPAAPAVTESTLWFGTVRRGAFTREVRGAGTLVPEDIRWIPAATSGRVDRIVLHPGANVEPGTVILELTNPELVQSVRTAELDWKAALAQLANQKATLANNRLTLESSLVDAESAYQLALSDLDVNQSLAAKGLAAEFTIKQKEVAVTQAKNRLDLVKQQLATSNDNVPSQLAPAQTAVEQKRAAFDQLAQQVRDLKVRAMMRGRLQEISVEAGQQVAPGANLARVSDPTHLMAELRIPETQTRDVAVGQPVDVDTRNGHVPGHVSRIDPASNGGTVGVDVTLDGALPAGARPELNVDGTVQLERLANVLYVESPVLTAEESTVSLFKVVPGRQAIRVPVKLGRRSVEFVEVVSGLGEGDRVILSDMSQYDRFDKITLN